MKTYVLILSRTFPAKHKRKGEATNFDAQTLNAVLSAHNMNCVLPKYGMKLHTIRSNYYLWRKRFEQIEACKACVSLRYWTGRPYHSKQIEICKLTKEDGIGLQKLLFASDRDGQQCWWNFSIDGRYCNYDTKADYLPNELASNDGLAYKDWQDWFRNYDLSKPLAIIHFTKFRY